MNFAKDLARLFVVSAAVLLALEARIAFSIWRERIRPTFGSRQVNKITLRKPGPGRPKGSRNKVTGIAKDIIAEAADRLGGVDRLVAWAKQAPENERAYWAQIFPKLLPLQVAGDPNAPLIHKIVREFVEAPHSDG